MKSIVLAFLVLAYSSLSVPAQSFNEEKANVVRSFCEALAAMAACNNVSMRIDTRKKIQDLVGEDFEERGAIYFEECSKTRNNWFFSENVNSCAIAKEKYGCRGSVLPGLLQDPTFKSDGVFCSF